MKNLYDIVEALQQGDGKAAWDFTEHPKIKAIIRKRLADYRQMYFYLPAEDLEDVEHGLRPRLIAIAHEFDLPEQRNEGRIVSYFALRILGEADFLLKKITGMRQVSDGEGHTYLKKFDTATIDGINVLDDGSTITADVASSQAPLSSDDDPVDEHVVNTIETKRQAAVLYRLLRNDKATNNRLWFECYAQRLQGRTWNAIASHIGYANTDYAWLRDNTLRFVSRLKDQLIRMGEQVSYRVCGIYTDASDVSICVIDSISRSNFMIWSKSYANYSDLDKVEAKLGDVFRQHDITYVIMNNVEFESPAYVIVMRYLHKKEAFVELIDMAPFASMVANISDETVGKSSFCRKNAVLLARIKQAHMELLSERSTKKN